MVRRQPLWELLVLILISAGFAGSLFAYQILFPENFDYLTPNEVLLGFITSVAAFWLAANIAGSDATRSPWLRFFDEFRIGTGINLIIQALLNYLDVLTRSLFLVVVGGFFAASLLAIARRFMPARSTDLQSATVMVGFDRASEELVPLLSYPLVEIVGDAFHAPAPVADYNELDAALTRLQPRQIIVTREGAGRVDPSLLLAQRLKGASVHSTPELYESLLGRVSCARREPVDLMLSQALAEKTQAMALQAIYTNIVGLVLLIAAMPFIAIVAILVALFSGPGPVIESAECAGFRKIPFLRMRFRTRRGDGTGRYTRIGRIISHLRLADLPLLFNIVRGEMALFGPRPVREEFTGRLIELIPFYSMRFAVKPGILQWGQERHSPVRISAFAEIEYDLYYVKHGSVLLDFEILMRFLFGGRRREESPVEFASAAR